MTEKKYTLLMQLGPLQGETMPIEGDEYVLGRDPESNWSIEDIEVSRRHARLIYEKGSYSIEDLGSTNGTFVNGQRIRTLLPLLPGATVRLGENVLLFYDVAGEVDEEGDTKTIPMDVAAEPAPMKEAPRAAPMSEAPPAFEPEAKVASDVPEGMDPLPGAAAQEPMMAASPAPKAKRRRDRSKSPIDFSQSVSVMGNQIGLGIIAIVVVGVLAITAFLWYVDANFLWCDVFGNMIPACR